MNHDPLRVADAFIQAGELDDALATLDNHLDAHPDDANTLRLRAAVLLRLEGEDHLRRALDDLERIPSRTGDDYYQQSVIHERLGDLHSAEQSLAQGHALAPDNERLTERYLNILVALGKVDEARALVEHTPRTWRWLRWRGDLATQANRYFDALGSYNAALNHFDAIESSIEPAYAASLKAQLFLARAQSMTHFQHYDTAMSDYEIAARLIPDDPTIPFNRGLVAALSGDIATALGLCGDALQRANPAIEEHMRKALSEDPRFAALAMLLLEGE